ncbi:MAG TPA: hypothetical protein VK742_14290 [Candidatus Sulfotelmatobacter sp.]|jgi:hypothetical protein|nr:hypothetical protein [Candidatus Sulfotelmatobacter sp.]
MKTTTRVFLRQTARLLLLAASLLVAAHASANPTVTTLGGGNPNVSPKYLGYRDGYTLTNALFHTPAGICLDNTGRYMFLADRSNNVVRYLDLQLKWTWTLGLVQTNPISSPIGVYLDNNDFLYVLNYGNKTNGTLLTYDLDIFSPTYGYVVLTNAMNLTNVGGMAFDTEENIYVTSQTNRIIEIAAGSSTVIHTVTVPYAGTSLQGLAMQPNGLLAVCDAGRNGIYSVNAITGTITTNAGFHGMGDFTLNGNNIAPANSAKFNGPTTVLACGDGTLVVADTGNNRVKAVLPGGVVTNLFGTSSNYWTSPFPGWADGAVKIPDSSAPNAQSRIPYGIALDANGNLYDTEDFYHLVRMVTGAGLTSPLPPPPDAPATLTVTTNASGQVVLTWSAVSTATNYFVERSTSSGGPYTLIATTSSTTYTDPTTMSATTYYYVVAAANAGGSGPVSPEASYTTPTPPPPPPRIGWFDYEGDDFDGFFTKLYPVSVETFNNDILIAIDPGTNGVSTYYITGLPPLTNNPSYTNGSSPPFYKDGLAFAQQLPWTDNPITVVKAVNVDSLNQYSAVTTAEFLFQVANPTVVGNNGAQFTVSDVTSNSVYWYTLDGTDPTNGPPSIGPVDTDTNNDPVNFSFNVTTNVLFKVRAFRSGYAPSGIAVQSFSTGTFNPNTLSFGFASGEASSDFVGSPGQIFYAPVTLTMITNTAMDSLQFNIAVTNAGPNPGPPVTPGAYRFDSFLEEPVPNVTPTVYETIPPLEFYPYFVYNPPPASSLLLFDGPNGITNFVSMETTNLSENLMSIGWLERQGQKNLFDTGKQSLDTFSEAHDVMYPINGNGQVEVGGYAFQIPLSATAGQTYQIQIARPSATTDGIGEPGSDIFILAPTNNNYYGGSPINAIKYVTVGQRAYIVGSVYQFRWFNAGDFGSSNIVSADVAQVFQSAIYGYDTPPLGSDLYDAMDSCGSYLANLDGATGWYTNTTTPGHVNALFNGNDTTINQLAYGDGVLDVCDVYVTFRRSLDPSLTWFRRYWTNGVRVADTHAANVASHALIKPIAPAKTVQSKVLTTTNGPTPLVNFTAGDAIGSAGKTISVPITAAIVGNYPVRVLALNLTVTPLDGAPPIASQITFSQAVSTLGAPYITSSSDYANFSAAWLDSTVTGLSGTVIIGYLNVTIPSNAATNAAYAIHFDHASGSPNGLASFQKNVLTGVLSTSSETNSSYNDGIPDSWRLRWFGTVNNILSTSNACPSGDGVSNWAKYVAGVDPSVAGDFPQVNSTAVPSGYNSAIFWPSVNGVQYVIKRSSSLFGNNWSILSTNTGNGGTMEFDDTNSGNPRFYRVLIQQQQ